MRPPPRNAGILDENEDKRRRAFGRDVVGVLVSSLGCGSLRGGNGDWVAPGVAGASRLSLRAIRSLAGPGCSGTRSSAARLASAGPKSASTEPSSGSSAAPSVSRGPPSSSTCPCRLTSSPSLDAGSSSVGDCGSSCPAALRPRRSSIGQRYRSSFSASAADCLHAARRASRFSASSRILCAPRLHFSS